MAAGRAPERARSGARGRVDETAREHDSGDIRIAPRHVAALEAAGLSVSGRDATGDAQIVEVPSQTFFVGTLFLPHMASTAHQAHPLVRAFVDAARERAYGGALTH